MNLLVDFSNMKLMFDPVGGEDQVWFFMVSGQVEMDCAPALCGIVEAQQVGLSITKRRIGQLFFPRSES